MLYFALLIALRERELQHKCPRGTAVKLCLLVSHSTLAYDQCRLKKPV
jgi:hypothetical protein